MSEAARDLHDDELEAAIDEHFAVSPAPRRSDSEQAAYLEGCSETSEEWALALNAHIAETFPGFVNRQHAAGLREFVTRMQRGKRRA